MFGSRAPRWSCTSFCLEMQNLWQKFSEKIEWRILKKVQPTPLNCSVCEVAGLPERAQAASICSAPSAGKFGWVLPGPPKYVE